MPSNATAKVELLGSYDPKKCRIIEDPYYVSFYIPNITRSRFLGGGTARTIHMDVVLINRIK